VSTVQVQFRRRFWTIKWSRIENGVFVQIIHTGQCW